MAKDASDANGNPVARFHLTLPNRTARVLRRSFSATGSNQEQREVPAFWRRSRCAKAAAGFGATSWDPTHESVLHQPAGVLAS